MSLTDVSLRAETITDVANEVRAKIGQVVGLAEIRLQEIHNLVQKHTRSAIASELGSDAATMLSVYNSLKDAVEDAKGITVAELPS